MTGPFQSGAELYWAAGWRGVLPLPPRKKTYPPAGCTGATGTDPSWPDVQTWLGDPTEYNIALRLPPNVLGIDVDDYGQKSGGATVAAREAEWGPLPATWKSSSRTDPPDPVSGIRFYLVPEGLAWPSQAGPDVELVHRGHRYSVVWPSEHPDTGAVYRWWNPDGAVSVAVPRCDVFPELPAAWVEGLTAGARAVGTARSVLTRDQARDWVVRLPRAGAVPCRRMGAALADARDALAGGAHDNAAAGVSRIVRLGDEGHAGTVTALVGLRAAFVAEVTRPGRKSEKKSVRSAGDADREWQAIVHSAVELVTGDPTGADLCDCDGALTGLIVGAAPERERPPQFIDGGTFILDAPEQPPAVWGFGTEVLWASGEALMLCGPPGVGKTTLCGQLLRARLGLSGSVLGYGVVPTRRHVLYLAMDRPQQIARSLRRHFSAADRGVLDERLVVWQGPPPEDVAKNPHLLHLMADMVDADTIFVDSLKDAAVGLTVDEVGAGYNAARQRALANGIDVVELHHLTKHGPDGRKPDNIGGVYGSMHLTAGAGSVVLLWGKPGDLAVRFEHLKQPAEPLGPWVVVHDHDSGVSVRDEAHEFDLPGFLVRCGAGGASARQVAAAMGLDDGDPNTVRVVRRKLGKLVGEGVAREEVGGVGAAGTLPSRWFAV